MRGVETMELKFFEKLLLERKEQILKNLNTSVSEIQDLQNVEINDDGDYASVCADNLIEHAIQKQQKKELEEIEYALKKIQNGEYGICEMCGERIKTLRLKIKPYAKYCIVCREIIEKEPSR